MLLRLHLFIRFIIVTAITPIHRFIITVIMITIGVMGIMAMRIIGTTDAKGVLLLIVRQEEIIRRILFLYTLCASFY